MHTERLFSVCSGAASAVSDARHRLAHTHTRAPPLTQHLLPSPIPVAETEGGLPSRASFLNAHSRQPSSKAKGDEKNKKGDLVEVLVSEVLDLSAKKKAL